MAAIELWRTVVDGAELDAPEELRAELPELLWLYQMGLVLFWVHDRSAQAVATRLVVARTVPIVVRAIDVSRLPALRGLLDGSAWPCSPTCAPSPRRASARDGERPGRRGPGGSSRRARRTAPACVACISSGRVKNASVATAKNSPGLVPAYGRSGQPAVAGPHAPGTRRCRRRSSGCRSAASAIGGVPSIVPSSMSSLWANSWSTTSRPSRGLARLAAGRRPHEHDRSVGVVGLAVDGARRVHQHALGRAGHRRRAAHRPAAHDDRADAVERRRRRGRGRAARRGRRRACAPRRSARSPEPPPTASCAGRRRRARRAGRARRRRAAPSAPSGRRGCPASAVGQPRAAASRWKRRGHPLESTGGVGVGDGERLVDDRQAGAHLVVADRQRAARRACG